MVLAFSGLRWEVDHRRPNASESGGRRDIRAYLKARAAERVVAIPDIAMPAVRRLAESDAADRERSEGRLYGSLSLQFIGPETRSVRPSQPKGQVTMRGSYWI